MDWWIGMAWRAFWVGLGASAVLIGQTVIAAHAEPAPDPSLDRAPPAVVAPAPPVRRARLPRES